eukprot:m.60884 g.60884  ORF g.60884 m.60884 type:complete len:360 (+) comp22899_c0_seq2:123-1202(+)
MNDEPLPTGWRQAVDRKTGRVFYGNELTQSTQWQRPSSKYTTRTRYANLQHSGGNKKATVRKNQIAILIAGAVLLYFGPSYFMDPDGVHSQEEDYMRRVQAHRQQQERQQQRGRGGLDVYNNVPGTVGNLKYTGVILPNKMVGAEFVYADLKSRSPPTHIVPIIFECTTKATFFDFASRQHELEIIQVIVDAGMLPIVLSIPSSDPQGSQCSITSVLEAYKANGDLHLMDLLRLRQSFVAGTTAIDVDTGPIPVILVGVGVGVPFVLGLEQANPGDIRALLLFNPKIFPTPEVEKSKDYQLKIAIVNTPEEAFQQQQHYEDSAANRDPARLDIKTFALTSGPNQRSEPTTHALHWITTS